MKIFIMKKMIKKKIKIILDDIYYFNNYKFEENINFNGDLILKLNSKKYVEILM